MELQLDFKTDKLKLSGPLPEDINAGNQMYGGDLAKWLCQALPQWKLTYMDEDWGWLVVSARDYVPVDERITICVYAYPDQEQGAIDFGDWMLTIATEHRTRWLGLFTGWRKVPYNRLLAKDVIEALEKLGVQDLQRTEND